MGEEELPFVALSELDYLCRIWPWALFAFMKRYQQDLERKRKEFKERFGCTQSGNCTHCGKYIQIDLGKRRTHKVPLSVKAANLSKYFPVCTVTREQWADMLIPYISGVAIDTLLLNHIGLPLCHRYRLISRTGSHTAFWGTYLRRLRPFPDESDSAVVRWLHRRLAQELASHVVKSTDSPVSGKPRSTAGHRTVSRSRQPRRLKGVANSAGGPESRCRLTAEMSSVQALMDLALPRFAGMADGPRQVHPLWSVASESMDQTSMSSVYLNLDALSSSSEESLDVKKRDDLSVTFVCSSEETGTRVNSEEVFSDEDFPAEFGARDIRRVVRRRASPPGGQTRGTARVDRRHEPPAPVVDLVTGKCKPGKVF